MFKENGIDILVPGEINHARARLPFAEHQLVFPLFRSRLQYAYRANPVHHVRAAKARVGELLHRPLRFVLPVELLRLARVVDDDRDGTRAFQHRINEHAKEIATHFLLRDIAADVGKSWVDPYHVRAVE